MNKFTRRMLGIKKAKRVIKNNPLWKSQFHTLIKTRKPCSCQMCGNRRKHEGETRQELISLMALSESVLFKDWDRPEEDWAWEYLYKV